MKKKIVKALLTVVTATTVLTGKAVTVNGTGNSGAVVDTVHADNIEVFHTETSADYERIISALENRNGKIIIEVINGTVLDADGNGIDSCGYYTKYDNSKFSASDEVQTIFVYNPENNAIDDILLRIDTLIE